MKTKKIIALALALCMALSVLSIGTVSAGAIEGGWEFSDISASNITADEQAIFNKAMSDYEGVKYEPKDVIATQSVSGKNYAFLCIATPVTAAPTPHWTIVTIYADFDGNAKVEHISTLDPANMHTTTIADDDMAGSWKSVKKENEAPVPENIKTLLKETTGMSYSPIAILGTQASFGTNYCILAYGTLVLAQPQTKLYEIDVNEDFKGNTKITSVESINIDAYVSSPTICPEPSGKEAQAFTVTAKAKSVKAKALKAKAQKVKAIKVKSSKGNLSYKLVKKGSSKKLFKKSSINGKGVITIKKCSLKKGTYRLKIKVSAAGTSKYKSASKTLTVKIKIK